MTAASKGAAKYGEAEREAIGLCIAIEALDDIASRALLDLPQPIPKSGQVEVRYWSREHQQLFLIRLLDFAIEKGDGSLTGIKGSCLDVLLAACESKSFAQGIEVASLKNAAEALRSWLLAESVMRLWLPTLSMQVELRVERQDLLLILANHAKHNLSRLTRISKRFATILERNGHGVDTDQIPLGLDDLREHLQEDYFVYYGTWLAELVSSLRWAVQDYLRDAFDSAYVVGEGHAYKYQFPESIVGEVPRQWFWRLMNHIRSGPAIERFAGAEYLKKVSATERLS